MNGGIEQQQFYNACRYGDLPEAKRLLASGANVNARTDRTMPIYIASLCGYIHIVRFLLDNGAEIDGTSHLEFVNCFFLFCLLFITVVCLTQFATVEQR